VNPRLWPTAADEAEQEAADFMAAHPELPDDWRPDPEDLETWWLFGPD
jgi:hypothetical protein